MDSPSPGTTIPYQQPPLSAPSFANLPGFPPPSGPVPVVFNQSFSAARPEKAPRPVRVQSPQQVAQDIRTARSTVEFGLREYASLQRRRYRTNQIDIDERLRFQAMNLLVGITSLRMEVSDVITAAEAHRWRRWLFGGVLTALIPAVRAIWCRPPQEKESSNDTEYAFRKSKSLIRRILDSVHGLSCLAAASFFVFAVVYVFQNEVSLRVARTVSKRLKQLTAKLERGDEEINENDIKSLKGWRWRVLLWQQ